MKGQVKKNGCEYISVTTARTAQEGKRETLRRSCLCVYVCVVSSIFSQGLNQTLPPFLPLSPLLWLRRENCSRTTTTTTASSNANTTTTTGYITSESVNIQSLTFALLSKCPVKMDTLKIIAVVPFDGREFSVSALTMDSLSLSLITCTVTHSPTGHCVCACVDFHSPILHLIWQECGRKRK